MGKADIVEVNMASKDGLHGFSSFAFVPGTKDRHVLALRSVEEDCAGDDLDVCKQRSYVVIFDVTTGEVLMDEAKLEQDVKFEGIGIYWHAREIVTDPLLANNPAR